MKAAPVEERRSTPGSPSARALPLRILLLQIRDHREAERQERAAFVAVSGLPADRFRFQNLLERPEIDFAAASDCDALVIGGAGAHSVTGPLPFDRQLGRLVEEWIEDGRPLFGSCFGHQFVAHALGGRVETDLERKEVGTFDVELTPAGEADPLFAGLPRRFPAQLGHHDRVTRLPPGGVELAYSARSPVQAYRIAGRPVWGCQFHVELDDRRMLERAAIYAEGYLPGDEELDRLRASLRPSPEASSVFPRFLDAAAAEIAARGGGD